MSDMISRLEELSANDSRTLAVLRRSLAFNPGEYIPSMGYVEPFIPGDKGGWSSKMYYLVAGLWAAHWRKDREGESMSIARACAMLDLENRARSGHDDLYAPTSTEQRFVTLLDSDVDQLPYRARQMTALLTDYPLDFTRMLWDVETKTGLLNWTNARKITQRSWAREFYRNAKPDMEA